MNLQQIVALLIVIAAAVFLGRNFIRACRSFFSNKSGCSEGCGKCGFAPKENPTAKSAASSRPNLISLKDIRTLPDRSNKSQF